MNTPCLQFLDPALFKVIKMDLCCQSKIVCADIVSSKYLVLPDDIHLRKEVIFATTSIK